MRNVILYGMSDKQKNILRVLRDNPAAWVGQHSFKEAYRLFHPNPGETIQNSTLDALHRKGLVELVADEQSTCSTLGITRYRLSEKGKELAARLKK